MRILIITDVSLYMRGGVPAEIRTLLGGLVARGHVLALAGNMSLDAFPQVAHFKISLPIDRRFTLEIDAALETFKPDFVHVMSMNSKGVALLESQLSKYRWALTMHSVPPHERKLAAFHANEALHYGARALRFLANSLAWRWVLSKGMAPLVIVHSQYVQDIVLRYGSKRDSVRMIALPFFSPTASRITRAPGDSPRLVTVGGYAHTKGQHDLVKALPTLLQRYPGLRCQLIGEVRDESYVAYLRTLAQSLGVAGCLLITPDLSQADKQSALEAADVYVQPSHEEGFCLAYAEAAAVVPRLVGTDTGAIASISQQDEGARVVAVRSPAAIAASVQELLQAQLPADHMSRRATRLCQKFSEAGYLDSHENLYLRNSPPPL